MIRNEVKILFILLDYERKAKQNTLALIRYSTEQHKALIESCLVKSFVYKHNISISQVVLSHGIWTEEHIIVPAWLVDLLFNLHVARSVNFLFFILYGL